MSIPVPPLDLMKTSQLEEDVICENPDCDNSLTRKQLWRDNSFCSLDCAYGNRSQDGRTLVKLHCETCGDSFEVKPSHADDRRTCSRECYGDYMSENRSGRDNPQWNRVEVNCEYCGDTYLVKKYRVDSTRFCSNQCMTDWQSENKSGENHRNYQKIEKECPVCGDEFRVVPAEEDRRVCCSVECMGEHRSRVYTGENHGNWKGGVTEEYFRGNWDENLRQSILDRDGSSCVVCGRGAEEIGRSPDVHHVIPRRFFGGWDEASFEENLVTLCQYHHNLFEGDFVDPRNLVPDSVGEV